MTTSVNKVDYVQEDLVKTIGISKRHSNRALVSMSKLIRANREILSLVNTSKVIYNNLWVDLVNKWSSVGTVEIIFPEDFDLIALFDVNEDLIINLTENSISYKSNQFTLGTRNTSEGKFITITGKKKYKDYLTTFDSELVMDVTLVWMDGSNATLISVTTLIESYLEELKSM